MSWIMTIAAGVALGYFLVQYFTKNTRLGQGTEDSPETETAGAEGAAETEQTVAAARLHKSSRDKKFAGVCGKNGMKQIMPLFFYCSDLQCCSKGI